MKKKLTILLIITIIITFIIYNKYYVYTINITSINSLSKEDNYNELLYEKIVNRLPEINYNIDFSNEDLEIENLISIVEHNTNEIQSIIHDSKVLIISIGNNDVKSEKTKVILNEYKRLFHLLRKYNNHEIIFVSPINFKNQELLKEICNNYKINYINTYSYISPFIINDKYTSKGIDILTNNIIKRITYIKNWQLTLKKDWFINYLCYNTLDVEITMF